MLLKLVRRLDFKLVFAIVCIVVLGILIVLKTMSLWPFENDKGDLVGILGPDVAPWLEQAEITTWQPDLNFKPMDYFVVRSMSEENFQTWAKVLYLTISKTPNTPAGLFVLPQGVKISRWLRPGEINTVGLDAQGTTSRAIIWSLWRGGLTYSVIHPTLTEKR